MYVHITFVTFFALFVPLFALNIRHGTRDIVQAHKLTLKQDFLYLETGHVTINPDFVSVIRPFNFDNIISLQKQRASPMFADMGRLIGLCFLFGFVYCISSGLIVAAFACLIIGGFLVV